MINNRLHLLTKKLSRYSISTQLLLSVNFICIMLLLVFVAHDYRQATKRRFGDKRIALSEEAILILESVRHIRHHGEDVLQTYVDSVCYKFEESNSPGHHIVVSIDDLTLQAQTRHQSNGDMIRAIKSAVESPQDLGIYRGRELVVGSSIADGASVLVSEFTDELRGEVVHDSLRRIGGSAALAIIAGLIVNVVLIRIVVRPVDKLVGIVDNIGKGEYEQQANGFLSREFNYLSDAVNEMSLALQKDSQRRHLQLSKARRIQENLLPASHYFSDVNIAVKYEPAEYVAGDFYDIHKLVDGSWLLMMADVTGHGIPAAMSATLLKAHLAEACAQLCNITEIVEHLNSRFTQLTLPGDFASAIIVRYVPDNRLLQIVNAGHDSGLYLPKGNSIRECTSSGLLLGIQCDSEWSVQEIKTIPGDRLLLFTDGVTENFDTNGVMYGRDSLISFFKVQASRKPADFLDKLFYELSIFRAGNPTVDDTTAICMEF